MTKFVIFNIHVLSCWNLLKTINMLMGLFFLKFQNFGVRYIFYIFQHKGGGAKLFFLLLIHKLYWTGRNTFCLKQNVKINIMFVNSISSQTNITSRNYYNCFITMSYTEIKLHLSPIFRHNILNNNNNYNNYLLTFLLNW